jgi:hypothetical protein
MYITVSYFWSCREHPKILWNLPFIPVLDMDALYKITCSSQSHIATDGRSLSQSVSQSVSQSWCRAHDQIFMLFDSHGLVFVGRPLWREDGCLLSESLCAVISHLSSCKRYLQFYTLYMVINVYTICTGPLPVQAQYSRLCTYFK